MSLKGSIAIWWPKEQNWRGRNHREFYLAKFKWLKTISETLRTRQSWNGRKDWGTRKKTWEGKLRPSTTKKKAKPTRRTRWVWMEPNYGRRSRNRTKRWVGSPTDSSVNRGRRCPSQCRRCRRRTNSHGLGSSARCTVREGAPQTWWASAWIRLAPSRRWLLKTRPATPSRWPRRALRWLDSPRYLPTKWIITPA